MYLRGNFNSSKLVHLLSGWSPVDAQVSRQDFAERLGLWLGAFDATTLHDAHRSIRSMAAPSGVRPAKAVDVEQEFHRVRDALVKHLSATQASPEPAAGFAPYRRRYIDRQRHMELKIGALRGDVRKALASASPQLAQLAALDAALDRMLDAKAQKMLATVPVLLEKRFAQLRKSHAPVPDLAHPPADSAVQQAPDSWLHAFGKEVQEVLLAELDDRLLPVVGLIEAFNNEFKNYP